MPKEQQDIAKPSETNILEALHHTLTTIDLSSAKTVFDQDKCSASIYGTKDGFKYAITISSTDGSEDANAEQERPDNSRLFQIKRLHDDGLTQAQIANLLGISQPTVSKYLKKA